MEVCPETKVHVDTRPGGRRNLREMCHISDSRAQYVAQARPDKRRMRKTKGKRAKRRLAVRKPKLLFQTNETYRLDTWWQETVGGKHAQYTWPVTVTTFSHSRRGHGSPGEKQRYTSTLSLTSTLDGGMWLTPRSRRLTPTKQTQNPIV